MIQNNSIFSGTSVPNTPKIPGLNPSSLTLQDAFGSVPYSMTNDYLFRAVLQSNNSALTGLVCSLLHLSEKDIVSITVTNPIILGEALTSKECRLDIHVLLNDHIRVNLEMQVANRLNWQNRSILYLCRDREEYYQDLLNYERVIAEKDASIAERDAFIAKTVAEKNTYLAELQKLRAEVEQLRKNTSNIVGAE